LACKRFLGGRDGDVIRSAPTANNYGGSAGTVSVRSVELAAIDPQHPSWFSKELAAVQVLAHSTNGVSSAPVDENREKTEQVR